LQEEGREKKDAAVAAGLAEGKEKAPGPEKKPALTRNRDNCARAVARSGKVPGREGEKKTGAVKKKTVAGLTATATVKVLPQKKKGGEKCTCNCPEKNKPLPLKGCTERKGYKTAR